MAMSTGGGDDTPMSDINTTPLVDIMLVLLIIFLIAVPVALQTATLELPKVAYKPNQTKPQNILLSIRADPSSGACEVYRNTMPIDNTELLKMAVDNLEAAVKAAGGAENLKDEDIPEVHVRADVNTPWRCVGGAIFVMQQAGFPRVGFVSTPPAGS